MKDANLIRSVQNPETWLCECGNPVATLFFGADGYLSLSSKEVCDRCGMRVNEDSVPDEEIITYHSEGKRYN